MPYRKPAYSRDEVDAAGKSIVANPDWERQDYDWAEYTLAFGVVDNWRASHLMPLNVAYMTLRRRAHRVDPHGIVAQRIKRLSSITDKLERYDWLTLSEMQDIGGCRVVVDDVAQVYDLVNLYKTSRSLFKLADEDDYIVKPKASGYRGYHLIYQYYNSKKEEYDGLKVELQLRSSLQHIWATAVETVDVFLRQGLKANRGSAQWRRFFALMGSLIALREDRPPVPDTPTNYAELVSAIRKLAQKLNVAGQLSTYTGTLKTIQELEVSNAKYLILKLDASAEVTTIYGYRASASGAANDHYLRLEQEKTAGEDVVLVSVEHAQNLRHAYPNYFLDATQFLDLVKQISS